MSQPQSTFSEGEQWRALVNRVAPIKEQQDRLENSRKLLEDLRNLELPLATPKIDGGRANPNTDYEVRMAQRRADHWRDIVLRNSRNRPPVQREEGVKEKYAKLKDLDEKSRNLELQLKTRYPAAVPKDVLPPDLTTARIQAPSIRSSRLGRFFGFGSEEPVTREAVQTLEDSCKARSEYLDAFEANTKDLLNLIAPSNSDAIATVNQPTRNGNPVARDVNAS